MTILKKGQKQGINLGVKKDKPQSAIYHPLMNMLKNTVPTVPVKYLQFDVMNERIDDCFEILVILDHVSLDIH